jgi:hypothetical protein
MSQGKVRIIKSWFLKYLFKIITIQNIDNRLEIIGNRWNTYELKLILHGSCGRFMGKKFHKKLCQ